MALIRGRPGGVQLVPQYGPPAAPFPSVLSVSGTRLADANGHIMPRLKGFVVQPIVGGWSAQTWADMYSMGARIARTVVYWDKLQPTGPPASGTDFSGIDVTGYITTQLDVHIQRLVAAGFYTVFTFYYGPGGKHSPAWSLGDSTMTNYVTYGQAATNYLAQRYGDSSDPLGAGQYTPAVIGFGINEVTPDASTASNWLTTLISQQTANMVTWMRTYAPNWIACLCCGFGATAPYANAPGSGQTGQTFTSVGTAPTTNFLMEMHDYLMASADGSDTRSANGEVNNNLKIGTDNLTNTGGNNYTTYPPAVSGTALTQAQCRADMAAYVAPYAYYCSPAYANVPLMLGEFGWAPADGTTTFTGAANWIADKMTTWGAAAVTPAIAMQWDYNVNLAQDSHAARPGAGSASSGVDANGWQTVTNNFFAGF